MAKLKIGAHRYQVVYVKDHPFFETDKVGYLDRPNGKIYISSEMVETEKQVSLLHEIIHVINGELAENVVDPLAQQFLQVLIDNDMCYNKKHGTNSTPTKNTRKK